MFEDEIKEQDGMAVMDMLRRASIDIDINRINSAGEREVFVSINEILKLYTSIYTQQTLIKETSG